jgi:hypothetical protein
VVQTVGRTCIPLWPKPLSPNIEVVRQPKVGPPQKGEENLAHSVRNGGDDALVILV